MPERILIEHSPSFCFISYSETTRQLREAQGNPKNTSFNLSNLGVPNPVAGSQPSTALKPCVSQPGLSPSKMSLNSSGCLYSTGCTKPTGPLPTAVRSSLMSVKILPHRGAARLVPYCSVLFPPTNVANLAPLAEISGKARPLRL